MNADVPSPELTAYVKERMAGCPEGWPEMT